MWVFTETGFLSAVKSDGGLMVRSRDRESLEALSFATNSAILHTPKGDYPYRLITDHDSFSKWISHSARNIDYPNFKSQVAMTRGREFADALSKVWSVMHQVEDGQARKGDKQ